MAWLSAKDNNNIIIVNDKGAHGLDWDEFCERTLIINEEDIPVMKRWARELRILAESIELECDTYE